MMKRYLSIWSLLLLATVALSMLSRPEVAQARKLKVYALPKHIVAGQMGIIVFQNPEPEHPRSQSKCTADRLIAWVKSDIPILRIEQEGKQVWMPLGSYQSIGDSCIATFMAPVTLEPGKATLFIVNGTDPSIPYYFEVQKDPLVKLTAVEGGTIKPLTNFKVIGDGFVPEGFVDEKKAREELEANIGLSKLPAGEQWTAVNHRIMKDWDKLPEGNFLYLEQGGKTWRSFVETCGLSTAGMLLEFSAPPDIQPGPITLTLGIRMHGGEVAKSAPITATVTP